MTTGTQLAVLYREVSLIQSWVCTQLNVVGTADSVRIREVSSIKCVLIERFHCNHDCTEMSTVIVPVLMECLDE